MKILIKNKNQLKKHSEFMEHKFIGTGALFQSRIKEPLEFPCVVISYITPSADAYIINYEFVYKNDFKL